MSSAAEPPKSRPLTGGAVMSAASRITVALTGALTTIFVARLLGPAGSGSFAIALTVVLMLTLATTLGVEHGIAYYVSAGKWAARDAFATSQRVALVVGASGCAVGVAARMVAPSAFGDLSVGDVAITAAALPFALSWLYVTYIALSTDHYEAYVLPPALQSATALLLVIVLGLSAGITGAVIGLTGSHVITAVAAMAWAHRRLPETGATPPRHALRAAVSFGVKGYAANALQFLNFRLDLFILSAVTSTAVVGQYSVALAVTTVLWLLPQALGDVLFPRVAALSHAEAAEAQDIRAFVEAKSVRHAVVVVAASTLVLVGVLVALVVPVYGAGFRPAIDMGLILLPGVALIGVANVLSATIVGRGKPVYSLYIALITTPLTVALYVVLVPAYEGTGAAIAKSLSFAASFVLAVVFYKRTTGSAGPALFLPTRSELADYRALPGAVRRWAAGLRST